MRKTNLINTSQNNETVKNIMHSLQTLLCKKLVLKDLYFVKTDILNCMIFSESYDAKTVYLTLLHSERPKLYTILAFLSAIGSISVYYNMSGQSGCKVTWSSSTWKTFFHQSWNVIHISEIYRKNF